MNSHNMVSLNTDTLSATAFAPVKADINGNIKVTIICKSTANVNYSGRYVGHEF